MKYPKLEKDGGWTIVEIPQGLCPNCFIKSGAQKTMDVTYVEQSLHHPKFGQEHRLCADCGHIQVAVIEWQTD